MPKQISDIRDFLQKARRKDARSVRNGALVRVVLLFCYLYLCSGVRFGCVSTVFSVISVQ